MRKVLTLNNAMIPIDFKDPKDAFKLLCKGTAWAFDVDFRKYTLGEWILEKCKNLGEFNDTMNTVKYEIPIPPVIVIGEFKDVVKFHIRPTKANIWKRDGASCAYCGKSLKLKDTTIDHIHPKSKGGKKHWLNVVASCRECNELKADKLLHENAKMELMKEPFVPKPTSVLYKLTKSEVEEMPEFWKSFFVEFK